MFRGEGCTCIPWRALANPGAKDFNFLLAEGTGWRHLHAGFRARDSPDEKALGFVILQNSGPRLASAKHFDPRVQAQSSSLNLGTMTGETLVAENWNDVTNKLDSRAFRGFLVCPDTFRHKHANIRKSGIVRPTSLIERRRRDCLV